MVLAGRERKQLMRSLELVVEQPKLIASLKANPRGLVTMAWGLYAVPLWDIARWIKAVAGVKEMGDGGWVMGDFVSLCIQPRPFFLSLSLSLLVYNLF